jgi:hypothetical protein
MFPSPIDFLQAANTNVLIFVLVASGLATFMVVASGYDGFRRFVIKLVEFFSVASLFLATFGGAAIGFKIAEAAQLADPERFNSMPLPAYGGGAGLIIGFLVSAFPLFIVFVLIDIAENARRSALVSAAQFATNAPNVTNAP